MHILEPTLTCSLGRGVCLWVFFMISLWVLCLYMVCLFFIFSVYYLECPSPLPPRDLCVSRAFHCTTTSLRRWRYCSVGKKQNLSRKVARNEHGDREGNVEEAWNQDCACKSNLACIISSYSFIPDGLEGILEVYLSLRSLHLFLPRTIPYR